MWSDRVFTFGCFEMAPNMSLSLFLMLAIVAKYDILVLSKYLRDTFSVTSFSQSKFPESSMSTNKSLDSMTPQDFSSLFYGGPTDKKVYSPSLFSLVMMLRL